MVLVTELFHFSEKLMEISSSGLWDQYVCRWLGVEGERDWATRLPALHKICKQNWTKRFVVQLRKLAPMKWVPPLIYTIQQYQGNQSGSGFSNLFLALFNYLFSSFPPCKEHLIKLSHWWGWKLAACSLSQSWKQQVLCSALPFLMPRHSCWHVGAFHPL